MKKMKMIQLIYILFSFLSLVDSSRRRAPAAADTEWIEGAFNKPGHRARVGGQSLRPARIELAPPKGGPTGRERSYAGVAQYPCAGH